MRGFSPVMRAAPGTSNCHVLCMSVWITNKNWSGENPQEEKERERVGESNKLPRLTEGETISSQ